MATSNKFSLRDNIKQRILKEMIANLKVKFPSVSNFIMVIDPITTKIMSSTVKPIDLLEEGILGLERLELGRKSFEETHAIYFIAPVEQSVNSLIKDFVDRDDPQYGNVHLFFTNRVKPALFEKLKKQKGLLERVLTFKEINIDFLTPEPNFFHLDLPSALPVIFSKQGQAETAALEERIASRLSTIIPNLIDYKYFQLIYNKNTQNGVAERVAMAVKERVERFASLKSKEDDDEENPCVKVVILDRTFDPVTPAVHDYHYKSMLYEFLGIEGEVVEFDDIDKEGKPVKKVALLNEKDDVWTKYKDLFISEAMMKITDDFDDFVKKNANLKMAKQSEQSLDLSQMLNIAKQMPMYEELLEKYTLHMSLVEQVIKIFHQKELMEIGDLEQCLATTLDSQGKVIPNSKLMAMIAQKIAQGKLDTDTKIRLMIITSFALELHERERKSLTQPLSNEGKDMIARLSWLGLQGSEGVVRRKSTRKLNDIKVNMKDKSRNLPATLCRHCPIIETLAEEVILNKVEGNKFRSVFVPNGDTFDRSWKENMKKRTNKIVFFVIGGITHDEIKSLNDIEKQYPNVTIIGGGTSYLTVKDYMNGIRQMTPIKAQEEIDIDDSIDSER